MYVRWRMGKSLFSADRNHLHHKFYAQECLWNRNDGNFVFSFVFGVFVYSNGGDYYNNVVMCYVMFIMDYISLCI